ncbi:MAG TPA: GNAT family N-acetyltransferase [Tepidisphaeraceae bacterium]|nr:GNAT family N-acetyltransferase [Tepidisphaeraceae bacterium]
MDNSISITTAIPDDISVILSFIRGLAEYEKLSHVCIATEDKLRETLFGEHPYAEVLIARLNNEPVGFALFFHNYSTFLARPGIYLEDLFVLPAHRNKGVGKALLVKLAQIARERNCGRLEWSVLDWNQPAIDFYQRIGAKMLHEWRICRMTETEISNLANSK